MNFALISGEIDPEMIIPGVAVSVILAILGAFFLAPLVANLPVVVSALIAIGVPQDQGVILAACGLGLFLINFALAILAIVPAIDKILGCVD